MKKQLTLLLFLSALVSANGSIKHHPIAIVGQFDWLGSPLERVAADTLREGDFIVYPGYRGLIESFRSSKYRVDPSFVLLGLNQVPSTEIVNYDLPKHQEGIAGIWINDFDVDLRFSKKRINKKALEYGKERGFEVVRCIDRATARIDGNETFAATYANKVVLLHDLALVSSQDKVIAFYSEKVANIRESNPNVEIWAAFNLKLEGNDTTQTLNIMKELEQQVDGFAFILRNDSEPQTTAIELLEELRS